MEYRNDKGAMVPIRVHTVLISTQHSPDVDNDFIHKELLEHVIKPVVPEKYLDDKTIFHLNPSGEIRLCSLPCQLLCGTQRQAAAVLLADLACACPSPWATSSSSTPFPQVDLSGPGLLPCQPLCCIERHVLQS